MAASEKQETVRLGFLTAIETADHAFVGGLLITNHFGRPLEFQCTAPVKPNRTQEILYGPTLVPYVLAELIGRTLLEKVTIKPHVLLTEQADVLEVRSHISIPAGLLVDAAKDGDCAFGRQSLKFHPEYTRDRSAVEQCAETLPRDADFREPFDRVREALGEATRAGVAA